MPLPVRLPARSRFATGARRAALGLSSLGWLWLLGLTVAALAGARISRPGFEAAGLTLGPGLVALACLSARKAPAGAPDPARWTLVLLPAIAAVLAFGWSLTLGPLSDDFVLWRWATGRTLVPHDWPYFRPLPLLTWRAIAAVGGGWMALHLVNVVLHACNSVLVGRIGSSWMGRRAGLAAGVLFAAFPASTEAVAWTAGVFDLSATACVLSAVAIASWMPRSTRRSVALLVVCVAGMLSKESAVVIPAMLLVITVLTRARQSRVDWWPVIASAGVAAAFLVVRAAMSPGVVAHMQALPASRRGWKDLLVRPFAGLALPVRTDAGVGLDAYVLALAVLTLVGLLLLQFLRDRSRTRAAGDDVPGARGVAIGGCWILLAALPLLAEFYVSPTLAGGRYLYLPSAGFAWLISAALAGKGPRLPSAIAAVALLVLAGIYASGLRVERRVWIRAGVTRDAILSGAAEAVRATPCRSIRVDDAPEEVDGAYVFRSGLAEALDAIPLQPGGRDCALRWTGTSLAVVPPAPFVQ